MAYGYDKNIDYTKLINEDIARQDYRSAAIHEAQRNEKVRGEGLTQYQTTNHYSDYLPKDQAINSGMDKLAQGSTWSYDQNKDPAWQALRKEYLREADRGTRDTMAAAASMTGGVPSTAAVQAGQQAGNYYRAQLADRLPELMQNDYSRYMQGREADRADLSMLASLEQQRFDNSMSLQQWDWQQKQQEWSNAMNRWATLGTADQYVASVLGVPVGTSTSDQAYRDWQTRMEEEQWGWQQNQQKISDAMNRWTMLGTADETVSQILGVPVGTSTQDASYRQWQQQQSERSDAYDRAMTYISVGLMPDAATLQAAGLSAQDAQRLVSYYQQRLAGQQSGGGYTPRTSPQTPPQTPPDEPAGIDWANMSQQERDQRKEQALSTAAYMLDQGASVAEANRKVREILEHDKTANIYDWDEIAQWIIKYKAQHSNPGMPDPRINYDMPT